MSTPASNAGWHPDPTGRFTHRYFDGTRWTDHVASSGVARLDPGGLAAWSAARAGTSAPVAGASTAGPVPLPTYGLSQEQGPKRSTAGFWVAGGVGVVAIIATVVLAVLLFAKGLTAPKDYPRASVPGQVLVHVHDTGKRIIYSEGIHFPLSSLDVSVTGPDGRPVAVTRYGSSLTYDVDGRNGRAVGTFEADTAGTYRVVARGSDLTTGGEFAVGTNVFRGILHDLRPAMYVLGLGVVLALAILFLTLWYRRRPVAT
jgi:hypothetical protein